MSESVAKETGMVKKRLPFGLDVPALWEWAWRILAILLLMASFYLNTVYTTKADTLLVVERVESVEKKLSDLPEAVKANADNLRAHIQSDAATNQSLQQIQAELSSVRATQAESMKNIDRNFDRVFRKLDALPPR